eukprot:3521560-Pyramimonas_sp.AAC.1
MIARTRTRSLNLIVCGYPSLGGSPANFITPLMWSRRTGASESSTYQITLLFGYTFSIAPLDDSYRRPVPRSVYLCDDFRARLGRLLRQDGRFFADVSPPRQMERYKVLMDAAAYDTLQQIVVAARCLVAGCASCAEGCQLIR